MRVSIGLTSYASLDAQLDLVAVAERLGLHRVWQAEHIEEHDSLVAAGMYLAATRRLEVGVMGLGLSGRHPGLTAMGVATLAELAPERLRVAIGAGTPEGMAKLGVARPPSVHEMKTYYTDLKRILRGERVSVATGPYRLTDFSLSHPVKVPSMDLLAIRPTMIETALEIADGIVLSAGASEEYLARVVERRERSQAQGRSKKEFRLTAIVATFVRPRFQEAYADALQVISAWDARTTEWLSAGRLKSSDILAARETGIRALQDLFTPELLSGISVVGAPDDVGDAIRRYEDLGVDEVVLTPFGAPDHLIEALEMTDAWK